MLPSITYATGSFDCAKILLSQFLQAYHQLLHALPQKQAQLLTFNMSTRVED